MASGEIPKKANPCPKCAEKAEPEKAATWTKKFPPFSPTSGQTERTITPYSMGNTREARESRAFNRLGFTSKSQTHIKRPYYTAALRLDKFVADSFTEEFKIAASTLANKTYDFGEVLQFINNWGDHGAYMKR